MSLPPLARYLPILDWGRRYDRDQLTGDMVAAVIVTIMLIPQSLAYALLAGMPPEAGIYASIAPIVLYAIFGTSRALAVGPVAVVSLMTAAAVGNIAESGTAGYVTAGLTLAFLSGAILLALGLFRLGFLANFLSHPVIAGFITASGILIAAGQMRHILGIEGGGHTLMEIIGSLWAHLGEINFATVVLGVTATAFLFWVRGGFPRRSAVLCIMAHSTWLISSCWPKKQTVRFRPTTAVLSLTIVVLLSHMFWFGPRGPTLTAPRWRTSALGKRRNFWGINENTGPSQIRPSA